jgi:hypothetical protein
MRRRQPEVNPCSRCAARVDPSWWIDGGAKIWFSQSSFFRNTHVVIER